MANGSLGSGWKIARVFGITIRLHPSWVLIFLLLTYSLGSEILPLSDLAEGGSWFEGERISRDVAAYRHSHPWASPRRAARAMGIEVWPQWHYWVLAVVGAAGLFVCVLAHELSHSLVAKTSGIPVEGITLFIFGGVARLREEAHTPGVEFKVAVVGPLMSMILGLACGVFYYGLGHLVPEQSRALLYYFMFINLALVVFNLLPGFPLDGGRLVRAVLWAILGDLRRATAIAATLGKILAGVLMAVGLLQILLALALPGVFGLGLGSVWWIVIGMFLWNAAAAGYRQLALKDALAGLTVRDVVRSDAVAVDPGMPLDRLVNEYFLGRHSPGFPVLEGDRLVGTVTLADVQTVPRDQWPTRVVRDVMRPVGPDGQARLDEDLMAVFRRLLDAEAAYLPVTDDGRLAGIVTRQDVLALLQIRTDLGAR